MERRVIPFTGAAAVRNRKAQGPMQVITGTVTSVTDLSHLSAVAFGVQSGSREHLFWISTVPQGEDPDYRRPLPGETVRLWFNESAKTLDVGGQPAQGVAEIQNLSNDEEQAAFAWFARQKDGPATYHLRSRIF